MAEGDFVKVTLAVDLSPGSARVFDVGGTPVALFNVNGTFHAINNNCAHRMGPLGEGEIEGAAVTCPWHGWRFDVTTGECLGRPGARVQSYAVKLEGGEVFVSV